MLKCYFASPFFNEEQVEREEALKKILRDKGIKVYSPKEECLLAPNASLIERNKVFQDNITSIANADFIFAITDGKDVGTIWECGFAYALEVPILYFCETLGTNPFNVMLSSSSMGVFRSREEVVENLLIKVDEKYNKCYIDYRRIREKQEFVGDTQ